MQTAHALSNPALVMSGTIQSSAAYTLTCSRVDTPAVWHGALFTNTVGYIGVREWKPMLSDAASHETLLPDHFSLAIHSKRVRRRWDRPPCIGAHYTSERFSASRAHAALIQY